jgi:hypothetical protein
MRQMAATFIALLLAGALTGAQQITASVSTHAVRGLVKSVSTTALVVSRSSRKASDLVFALNASTARAGVIEVGSTVSVRYRKEGKTLVATAVTVTPHKPFHPPPSA